MHLPIHIKNVILAINNSQSGQTLKREMNIKGQRIEEINVVMLSLMQHVVMKGMVQEVLFRYQHFAYKELAFVTLILKKRYIKLLLLL